jgi:nucleoid-associated protein YgaU
MTRETKIGLLVGLAFIIVIGILLSDHLTSATEPPQAQLAQVGNNVRSTTNAPGTNRASSAAGIFNTATNQQPTAPQHAVPTQNELANRTAQPVQIINVGGPAQNSNLQNPNTQQNPPTDPPVSMAPPVNRTDGPVVVNQPDPQQPIVQNDPVMPGSIADVAQKNGEELVGPNNEPIKQPIVNNTITQLPAGTTSYVAVSGDNVSKIARKFLGSDNKANREAIINANPSLKADANKIISGKSYLIPAKGATAAQPAPLTPDRTAQKPATTATQEHWYTVKEGDSLWKIAESQCGGGKAVAAIKELNKDIIKNDVLQAGQKIRLPNAPR